MGTHAKSVDNMKFVAEDFELASQLAQEGTPGREYLGVQLGQGEDYPKCILGYIGLAAVTRRRLSKSAVLGYADESEFVDPLGKLGIDSEALLTENDSFADGSKALKKWQVTTLKSLAKKARKAGKVARSTTGKKTTRKT